MSKRVDSDTTDNESVPSDTEVLLTVQEASERSGVGETAIRNALLRERLPFVLKYGRKLIRESDLEEYRREAKAGRPKKADTSEAPK